MCIKRKGEFLAKWLLGRPFRAFFILGQDVDSRNTVHRGDILYLPIVHSLSPLHEE